MCIDSLIAINSLSLAVFPVYCNATNKGKVAKLKLFIATQSATQSYDIITFCRS